MNRRQRERRQRWVERQDEQTYVLRNRLVEPWQIKTGDICADDIQKMLSEGSEPYDARKDCPWKCHFGDPKCVCAVTNGELT
jgi:hypothetical protein